MIPFERSQDQLGRTFATAVAALAIATVAAVEPSLAQDGPPSAERTFAERSAAWVPELTELAARSPVGLQFVVERYVEDRRALARRYDAAYSASRRAAFGDFHRGWLDRLRQIEFADLDAEGRVDYLLLENEIEHQLAELDREADLIAESAELLPFLDAINALHDARRNLEPADPRAAATALTQLAAAIDSTRERVAAGVRERDDGADAGGGADAGRGRSDAAAGERADADANGPDPIQASRLVAFRSAGITEALSRTLDRWYEFHHGYDPLFTWWAEEPYEEVDSALARYRSTLRRDVVGIPEDGEEPIVGEPLGRESLLADLEHELIPYTPEELIAIGRRELEWGIEQMRLAANDLGYGDDWRAALEAVKEMHVEPGEQPELIRELAREAEDYVEEHDLVTVPPLAKDVWRMEMMSPERQRVAPFFLGGEVIIVSYPTHEMTHDEKLMSMRGNNPHFARAVAHHELIPGHHLQGFMSDRYFPYRNAFATPFWNEGNAFYWELIFWDRGFVATPEDRIGALFWRNHRAARIIFSLSFHLGEMTPEEAIDLLVEEVGHERANAEAEVRRSFNGSYSPLYQVAYMLGGLQFYALHEELVDTGRMSDREYHDAILQGGRMPVEMVRARLADIPLERDWQPAWRFIDVPDGD